MSREARQTELPEKTQQLLQGPLKHVRAAALAAVLVPLASVAVSRAVAQIDCSAVPPPPQCLLPPNSVPDPCDFVTSGGFVITDSLNMANFGAHGGCKNGRFWGHINYVDHGGFAGRVPYHVNSIEVTGYLTPVQGSNVRDICGVARTNSAEPQPVMLRIRLVDNGEPGVADTFGIRLSNGYLVTSRPLNQGQGGGGNVMLHEPNPSTTAPSPPPSEAQMCFGLEAPELAP
jgi:hypothetical protein